MQPKLKRWIKARLECLPGAERFELRGTDETVLVRFERIEGVAYDEQAGERAEDCWQAASEHADAFEGRQRFRLIASAGEGEVGTLVFAIGKGATGAAFSQKTDLGESTERGLLAQLMRHNQQLAAINVESVQSVLGPLISENQDLRKRIGEVEERRIEWFEALESLGGKKHERELEAVEAGARAEFRNRMMNGLADKWIPELLAKLQSGASAAPALPASRGEVEDASELVRSVLGTIDKPALLRQLDSGEQATLDGLCGIGVAPATLDDFRARLRGIWLELPDEVASDLTTQILARPDLAARLSALLETPEAN